MLAALKPGGRFLVELINRSAVLARFRPRLDDQRGGVRIATTNRWDGRTGRMHNVWTFSKGRKVERHRFSLRLYTGAELRSVLRSAGFREIRLYGRPPLGRLTRHSRRLIAVARRPAS
jgi:hypothetical protein